MTDEDKELLMLAAKAGGYEIEWYASSNEAVVGAGGFYRNEGVRSIPWNSFSDDADAFRLAVKLKLELVWLADGTVEVLNQYEDEEGCIYRWCNIDTDGIAGLRQRITEVAAEIGKRLP